LKRNFGAGARDNEAGALGGLEMGSVNVRETPSDNKDGFRLRPPAAASAQPAFRRTGQASGISVVSVAEPGNEKIEAGSETAERYGKCAGGL
jgi:hypothetical protein